MYGLPQACLVNDPVNYDVMMMSFSLYSTMSAVAPLLSSALAISLTHQKWAWQKWVWLT